MIVMRLSYSLCIALVFVLVSCDGDDGGTAASSTSEPHAVAGLDPCKLLTSDQVTTVLPGADEGFVAKAGGSLIAGIDSYQCSYSDPSNNLFLVMFHIASDEKLFQKIKPKSGAWIYGKDKVRSVELGDRGWLYLLDDELKLESSIGLTAVELKLDTADTATNADALVALGRALLNKLR